MANSSSLLSAIALLLLLSATAAHARLLHRVSHLSDDPCKKTSYPKLCVALINSGDFKSDMDLEVAGIKQAIDKVNDGATAADKAFNETPETESLRRTYLDSCKGYYGTAANDLQTALGYLTGTGSDLDVNINLSAALTDISTCSTEWGESGMKDFPLEHVDKNLSKLVSNLLALGAGLKGPKN